MRYREIHVKKLVPEAPVGTQVRVPANLQTAGEVINSTISNEQFFGMWHVQNTMLEDKGWYQSVYDTVLAHRKL